MSKKKKRGFQWHMPQLSFRMKVALVIAAVVVICAAVMGIVMLIANSQKSKDSETGVSQSVLQRRDEKVKLAQHDGALRDSAQSALQQGDVNKANDVYSQAIDAEDNATRKVQLAIDQSGVLYSAGKSAEAIDVAKKALTYSSDQFLAAYWLARLYENQHQYALSAQYYTLAGKWATSPTNEVKFDQAYFDKQAARVTLLEGQQ